MLADLARWLRAAGHDTAVAVPGTPDRELTRRAVAEDRVLLTRDRRLAVDRPAAARVVVLPHEALDATARRLVAELGLDWLEAPFTRCMVDDAPLEAATAAAAARAPPEALATGGPFTRCPACGRLYWPGSHVRRMRAQLEAWAAASGSTIPASAR